MGTDKNENHCGTGFDVADLPFFFLELDSGGKVLRSNAYSRDLTGQDPIGKHFREIIVDFNESLDPFELASSDPDRQLLNISTFTGLPQTLYCRFRKFGQNLYIIGSVDPKEQERMRHQVAISNQQLGNLTRELQKANADLEKLSELKSQFLGMAVHDLRQPLGVVQGLSELLLVDPEADSIKEEFRNYIERIHRSADFMRRLIDDFLDVAMIESGKFKVSRESVTISEILDNVLDIVLISAKRKDVHLNISDEARETILDVDARKIEQALINLISNAIDHSNQGALVKVYWELSDEQIAINVEDHGVGISKEMQARLFDPYGSGLSKKTGGESSTGLGLVISNKIAIAHGGEITFESEQGEGSIFTLRLPVKRS